MTGDMNGGRTGDGPGGRRIGITGWFGSDNLGDEILLHALLGCVRAADASASFVVLCPDPDRVGELHGVDAAPMPRLRGAASHRRAARRAIAACDVLFIGPGTVFQERSPNLRWPGTLPMFARIVATARTVGTPVVPVGVGVREGGTVLGRGLVRAIGAASATVGARDRRSAALLGSRARVIGDLAYAVTVPTVDGHGPRFAVSMRPLGPGVEDRLRTSVAACARRLVEDGWTGAFLPMAFGRGARGEDDRTAYAPLAGSLDLLGNPLHGHGLLGARLDDWLRELGGHGLLVGTRLHAVIMAIALGVPTVAVAYERKVADTLTELGLERFVVAADVDADTLHRTALAAVASAPEFAAAAARIEHRGRVAREFVASTLGRPALGRPGRTDPGQTDPGRTDPGRTDLGGGSP
jgi:polysaccharide pyruvyl transferase WcaK-like protein